MPKLQILLNCAADIGTFYMPEYTMSLQIAKGINNGFHAAYFSGEYSQFVIEFARTVPLDNMFSGLPINNALNIGFGVQQYAIGGGNMGLFRAFDGICSQYFDTPQGLIMAFQKYCEILATRHRFVYYLLLYNCSKL